MEPGGSMPHSQVVLVILTLKIIVIVSLGCLGVTCSPRDPRCAGSNPTEVDGFFQDVKILSTSLKKQAIFSRRIYVLVIPIQLAHGAHGAHYRAVKSLQLCHKVSSGNSSTTGRQSVCINSGSIVNISSIVSSLTRSE